MQACFHIPRRKITHCLLFYPPFPQLPDGQEIHVGSDRFKVPELLFQPGLLASYPGVKPTSTGTAAALHSEKQLRSWASSCA